MSIVFHRKAFFLFVVFRNLLVYSVHTHKNIRRETQKKVEGIASGGLKSISLVDFLFSLAILAKRKKDSHLANSLLGSLFWRTNF